MEPVMSQSNKSFAKFMLLWSGQLIAAIGNGLTSFGLGVYVFEQTGKASAMAIVTLLAFLPAVLLGVLAGVLADRYDRRLLMVLGDGLSAVGLIFILACMVKGNVKFWQICVGVTISSVFSSLLEPAYRATVTDLLTKEQYTKASGLVQIAASAKYLISPIIAGFLLAVSDIKLLLLIDICTLFVTVFTTLAVRKGIVSTKVEQPESFFHEFGDGWKAVTYNKGVLILVIMTSVMTFCLGFIQMLFTPLLLAFTDTSALGAAETFCASGMLVTSLLIGVFSIKKNHTRVLSVSLFGAGIFMAGFGLRENMIMICASGFLFFAMLPFIDSCVDFLLRTNISNDTQGRAWGIIGVLSQLGYIAAYMLSGVLADYIFTPLLLDGGALADSVGKVLGTGSGRGAGFLILLAGLLLCATAIILYQVKSVKALENRN